MTLFVEGTLGIM